MEENMSDSDYKELTDAGTAVVADIFDTLQRLPPVLDNHLFPVDPSLVRFAGPAYTVTGKMHQWSGSGDRDKLAAIDAMPAGAVALWAGADIHGVCCFGDILATAMKARGVAGVVVDGGVRDTAEIKNLGLPVLTRYRTPAQAIGRWHVTARQVEVQVRGALEEWVAVNPGDIVVADEDGVIVVPRNLLEQVLQRVRQWHEKDSAARREIAQGLSLLEALDKYGHL
jgi:4-hydroxy-4-methyl-2-oxoglutarate aldolase